MNYDAFSESTRSPEAHPLRDLFGELVTDAFHRTIGLPQQSVSVYLTDLLTEFAYMDNLYQTGEVGRDQLQEVVQMQNKLRKIPEHDPLSPEMQAQERALHKHIGDFTLFWVGIYPEALRKLRTQGHADQLIDYVRQGKQSYYIVSTFQRGRFAEDAGLFQSLSEQFELCLFGLSLVRREWEKMAFRV